MGKFKDENGKTRIGLFLQNTAPNLLKSVGDLTGIGALKSLSGLIGDSGELSPEQKQHALELLKMDIENEKEVTKRHQADMVSDSWLSKNVRPLSLIFLMVLLAISIIWDSASKAFNVEEAYIILLKTLLVTAFVFYFGGRDIQKGIMNSRRK